MLKQISDPRERGGLTRKIRRGVSKRGLRVTGKRSSVAGKIKFDTVREQITLGHPSGPTVLSLPLDKKSGASVQ